MMRSYCKNIKLFGLRLKTLKKVKLNPLSVYDDRYIKTKIRRYGDRAYTNFHGLNVPEDDIECESFTVTSIDSLLCIREQILSASIFRQLWLQNCKQTNDRLS